MTPETLARQFHDTYEALREEPATSWDAIPEGHRKLLIATSERILESLFPVPKFGHTYDETRQCTKCMTLEWEQGGGTDPCPLD